MGDRKDPAAPAAKDAFADLIAVPGDPLKDVAVLSKIDWVMKAGEVVRPLAR